MRTSVQREDYILEAPKNPCTRNKTLAKMKYIKCGTILIQLIFRKFFYYIFS